jgi:hypothetical protein
MSNEEQKDQLAQWPHKRIAIEATVQRIGKWYDKYRKVYLPSYCLRNIEIREPGDRRVIDHMWCIYGLMFERNGIRQGDIIRCTVQTYQYKKVDLLDPTKYQETWSIKEPRDVICLTREIAREEPVEPERTDMAVQNLPARDTTPEPDLEYITPGDPKRELFNTIFELVESHGIDRVHKTLSAIESLIGD